MSFNSDHDQRYFRLVFFPRKCNLFTRDIYVSLQPIHDKRGFMYYIIYYILSVNHIAIKLA